MRSAGGNRLGHALSARLGERYSDQRTRLPANPSGPAGDFGRRPQSSIAYIAIHHTVGGYLLPWADVARDHIEGRGFAGIGYHLGVQSGTITYLGDALTTRACTARVNHRVLCLCFAGDYHSAEGIDPRDEDIDAAREAVLTIDAWLGREVPVVGHRDLVATACPGDRLYSRVAGLRAGGTAALREYLLDEAEGRRLLELNPTASLLRHMLADGFVPVGDEFSATDARLGPLVAHAGERPATGTLRVYYAPRSDYNAVGYVTR